MNISKAGVLEEGWNEIPQEGWATAEGLSLL